MELEKYKCEVCPHKQKWIPAKERLPRAYEPIIACFKDGLIYSCVISEYELIKGEIVAWMPLPEPYKEGE